MPLATNWLKGKECMLLVAILILGAFFRFYELKSNPPGLYPDEAMNGNNALEALYASDSGGLFSNWKVFYPENNGREGLFINLQAVALRIFGLEPWALRAVSAIFGTLTILGLYLLTKELLGKNFQFSIFNFQSSSNDSIDSIFKQNQNRVVAALSAFFLATSYWHINFSRIGFRAIMLPFFSVFAMYFLLRGLRRQSWGNMLSAGIFTGLGLQTYIAFRFMPFVMLVPIIGYLIQNSKLKAQNNNPKLKTNRRGLIILFVLVAVLVFAPLGVYFLKNPADFVGRSGQVSIFSVANPLLEFTKSNLITLGMFFVRGDCNWRHNYNCQPELNPIVAVLFLLGISTVFRELFKNQESRIKNQEGKPEPLILFSWLFLMSLPATLTREGLPHALRSLGMIPPVMILAALGAWKIWEKLSAWIARQEVRWPDYSHQLRRIKRELIILSFLLLAVVPLATFRDYFLLWAGRSETYFEFDADIWHLGQFLNSLPPKTEIYVMVNRDTGVQARGIPLPAQPIMFATNTFAESRVVNRKRITYLLPDQTERLQIASGRKTVIGFINGRDKELIKTLQNKFPELKVQVPGDFVVLTTP